MELANQSSSAEHRSVFVVEDDLELSSIMDRILRSIHPGIQLSWATSAEEALAALKVAARGHPQKPYDLIIADIFLEGEHTGLDLWHHGHLLYPEVPWVVTSSAGVEKLLALIGADDEPPAYLHKPFSVSEGRQLFQSLLYPIQGPRGHSAPASGATNPRMINTP